MYRFLFLARYLKAIQSDATITESFLCQGALPQKEIAFIYMKEILDKLTRIVFQSRSVSVQKVVYAGNAGELQKQMWKLLLQMVSDFDTAKETFYHGLVLEPCAMMESRYYVTSNRESGKGQYDIQLMPKTKDMPGILIELKAAKGCSVERKETLAREALK